MGKRPLLARWQEQKGVGGAEEAASTHVGVGVGIKCSGELEGGGDITGDSPPPLSVPGLVLRLGRQMGIRDREGAAGCCDESCKQG